MSTGSTVTARTGRIAAAGAAGSSHPESSATASVAAMVIGIGKREGALKRV
jgi:hypothetical protein